MRAATSATAIGLGPATTRITNTEYIPWYLVVYIFFRDKNIFLVQTLVQKMFPVPVVCIIYDESTAATKVIPGISKLAVRSREESARSTQHRNGSVHRLHAQVSKQSDRAKTRFISGLPDTLLC